jgi:excisionase family DNA binding protein
VNPANGPQFDRLCTVSELAELLGLTRGTIYEWVETRRIPHLRLGRSIRFRPSDVAAILAEGVVR